MKHLVIPDTQVRPGVPVAHLEAVARYALEKRPDVIVHLGDHWDMPSLGAYESAVTKAVEARDIAADIEAGNTALSAFNTVLRRWNRRRPARRRYKPRLVLLRGNHEERILRYLRENPWAEGLLSAHPLQSPGWEVHEFLAPVVIDGIAYCHFFCRAADGNVKQSRRGAPNARLQVIREGMSATAGHQQGLDLHRQPVGGGQARWGLIAGSFYQHEETYLTPQGTSYWRGVILKHEVRDGDYDPCIVSMGYLLRKYT